MEPPAGAPVQWVMRLALAPLTLAAAFALPACSKPAAVDVEPASLRFGVRGQTGNLHATPRASGGKPMPESACAWT
jgi:hypothetical protein